MFLGMDGPPHVALFQRAVLLGGIVLHQAGFKRSIVLIPDKASVLPA